MASRTYSHSALGTYRSCPRKFRFQYVDRVKVVRVATADTFLGSAVHLVLAKLYKLAADGVVMPLEEVIEAYRSEWDKPAARNIKVLNDRLTVDDYMSSGAKMLETYYNRYQPFDQGTLLGAEMSVTFPLADTSFKFRAIIDRLWKRPDGVIEIIDYKTGKRLPQGGSDKQFLYQMALYQLAVEVKWPDFREIELVQHFLKMDETIRYRLRPDELDELVEDFRSTVVESLVAERHSDFPTSESGLCSYCDYYDLCPAKRHARIMDAEVEAGDDEKASMTSIAELAREYIDSDTRLKLLKAEQDALKDDLLRSAVELKLDKVGVETGDIIIRQSHTEKFITKTEDAKAFAELSRLAGEWQLEAFFKLDGRAMMKEMYAKRRFTPEQATELKPFIVEKDEARVTIRRKKTAED